MITRASFYRTGPVSIIPLMIAWTVAVSPLTDRDDTWAWYPLFGFFAIVCLWHVALIVTERGWQRRLSYAVYAAISIPFFLLVASYCFVAVAKDGL